MLLTLLKWKLAKWKKYHWVCEKLSKLQGILCERVSTFLLFRFFSLFFPLSTTAPKESAPKRATNKSDLSSFSEGVRNMSRNSARKHFKNQIFFCYIVLSLSLVYLEFTWDKRLSGNSAALSINSKWTRVCKF